MLYHVEVGMPKTLALPHGTLSLAYSHHARTAAAFDRYGDVSEFLPATLDTREAQVIEVETDDMGHTVKVVYRLDYDDEVDMVLAVAVDGRAFVKTMWLNLKNDSHCTLDRARYAVA